MRASTRPTPMPYTFESEPHGVYKRFSGHVSAREFLAFAANVQAVAKVARRALEAEAEVGEVV